MEKGDLEQRIVGCKKNEENSFSRLVNLYAGRLYGYFYRLTGNSAVSDDLISELFLKLVKNIKTYRGGNFNAWIFKIASNVFKDHLRALKRDRDLIEDQKKNIAQTTENEKKTSENEDFDRLQNVLARLDDDTKEVIMLRFYSGLNFKEIAETRKEPIGTTLSKVHRGLKRLREMIKEQNNHEQ